jgi:DNA-binding NarL/FixJ family response regulator
MDILLVEGDARRRVAIGKHLASCGHRVTISNTIVEAQEILHFIKVKAEAPNAVIVAENLLRRDGAEFRAEVGARFPATNWIPLPHDRDLDWLADWLEKVSVRPSRPAAPREMSKLDVLLIESDDRLRDAISARLTARGERVGACRTLHEASDALAVITDRAAAPLVIISPVGFTEGDGISFYISARRRFPDIRWLVSLPPAKHPASAQKPRLAFSASRPPTAESSPQTRR